MPYYLPESIPVNSRSMVFVDGENLSIRYKYVLDEKEITHPEHVKYEKDIYVWSHWANIKNHANCTFIRSFYYTCAMGDGDKIDQLTDDLLEVGITDPRVFKKKSDGRSKKVDISLATEMLSHAYNNNYEVAVLVAGDEDYVPLVKEVKRMGKQVALWFFESGLSIHLKREADIFFDISYILCKSGKDIHFY